MNIVEDILIILSLFLMVVGTIAGTFMKNYYVRLHYIGISDTVGGSTLLITFGIFSSHHFVYIFLAALVLAQGPAIAHLLARGAVHYRIKPEEEKWHSRKS